MGRSKEKVKANVVRISKEVVDLKEASYEDVPLCMLEKVAVYRKGSCT